MKLKVCGITNEADAIAAAQANVGYLGYVINYTQSPRFISPRKAQQIIERVKQLYPLVQHVAVLVTPTAKFVEQLDALPFDIYQVYGAVVPTVKPIWQSTIAS